MSTILSLTQRTRIPIQFGEYDRRGFGESETNTSSRNAEQGNATGGCLLKTIHLWLPLCLWRLSIDPNKVVLGFLQETSDPFDHITMMCKYNQLFIFVVKAILQKVNHGRDLRCAGGLIECMEEIAHLSTSFELFGPIGRPLQSKLMILKAFHLTCQNLMVSLQQGNIDTFSHLGWQLCENILLLAADHQRVGEHQVELGQIRGTRVIPRVAVVGNTILVSIAVAYTELMHV
mmetsp:Transcript_3023/g.9437  ORF Transcript_3023/g.9437 Transcript_3023/m.9437 type:complete len:232 (-) Transcript_3023:1856-2551(-)